MAEARPWWANVAIGAVLLGVPILAAFLDRRPIGTSDPAQLLRVLMPSTISFYIILVSPVLARSGEDVVDAMRPLAQVSDEEFDEITRSDRYIKPTGELIAFTFFALVGLWNGAMNVRGGPPTWSGVCWTAANMLFSGLLGWAIYVSIATTRQTAAIHRLPMQLDPLDQGTLDVAGRQSLALGLVFIGGMTLGFLPVLFDPDAARLQYALGQIPMIVITLAIFL
jgi:hypothetical protein